MGSGIFVLVLLKSISKVLWESFGLIWYEFIGVWKMYMNIRMSVC